MKSVFFTILIVLVSLSGINAQSPTYSEDVAEIIYNNCTSCHKTGGIAPFTLESYSDAFTYRSLIAGSVSAGVMPPWPPDVNYTSFHGERTLTDAEIITINEWVTSGAAEGNSSLAPPVPTFPVGKIIAAEPDLTLQMQTYTSQAVTEDEYACFAIPTGLTSDRMLRAIEVIPGNQEIVHHAVIISSPTNTSNCLTAAVSGQTITGYAPGAPPTIFPSGTGLDLGMKIKAGSYILMQMHYPKGTAGQKDSTSINLYFYPESKTDVREVRTGPHVMDWSIMIPADSVKTFTAQHTPVEDISILAVFPHMHLVGRKMKSYAVTPANDTIPLVNIEEWDFHWQGFYTYKNLIKIPVGSVIYGHATYDNTSNNHHHPYYPDPPQDIYAGEATTDEMFLISYQSLPYVEGDENFDLTQMLTVSVDDRPLVNKSELSVQAYPNPTEGQFDIFGWNGGNSNEKTQIIIQDVLGKIISVTDVANSSSIHVDLSKYQDGIYQVNLSNGEYYATKKIVLIR